MNAEIENLYQEIGQELIALSEDLQGKLLLYANIDIDDRFVQDPPHYPADLVKYYRETK